MSGCSAPSTLKLVFITWLPPPPLIPVRRRQVGHAGQRGSLVLLLRTVHVKAGTAALYTILIRNFAMILTWGSWPCSDGVLNRSFMERLAVTGIP